MPGSLRSEGPVEEQGRRTGRVEVGGGAWAGHGYALSHRCAAALWGFTRFTDEVIELTTTRNLRLDPPAVVHQVPELKVRDIASIQGFRVTSATRTLLDLAAKQPWENVRA